MELDRLLSRGRFLGDLTEHVLGLAGLQPGMRVLDVGCGNGDVAFVAARLVGPDGAVIGVDRDPAAIDRARARASLGNVRFLAADAAELDLDVPIDAVIGRQVLMHLAEPAATLRHLRKLLAPGGLIAFQEPDWAGAGAHPRCPLVELTLDRIRETLRRTGADPRAGVRLRQILLDAGVAHPRALLGARVEGGPDSLVYAELVATTRDLLGDMERTGVAAPDEVAVETLAARLREEVVSAGATVTSAHFIGAWGNSQ
ncbi:methyltransferase domain-containing protein [Phytohabitans flavus]